MGVPLLSRSARHRVQHRLLQGVSFAFQGASFPFRGIASIHFAPVPAALLRWPASSTFSASRVPSRAGNSAPIRRSTSSFVSPLRFQFLDEFPHLGAQREAEVVPLQPLEELGRQQLERHRVMVRVVTAAEQQRVHSGRDRAEMERFQSPRSSRSVWKCCRTWGISEARSRPDFLDCRKHSWVVCNEAAIPGMGGLVRAGAALDLYPGRGSGPGLVCGTPLKWARETRPVLPTRSPRCYKREHLRAFGTAPPPRGSSTGPPSTSIKSMKSPCARMRCPLNRSPSSRG